MIPWFPPTWPQQKISLHVPLRTIIWGKCNKQFIDFSLTWPIYFSPAKILSTFNSFPCIPFRSSGRSFEKSAWNYCTLALLMFDRVNEKTLNYEPNGHNAFFSEASLNREILLVQNDRMFLPSFTLSNKRVNESCFLGLHVYVCAFFQFNFLILP